MIRRISLWWRARGHFPDDYTDCPPDCELCAYKGRQPARELNRLLKKVLAEQKRNFPSARIHK